MASDSRNSSQVPLLPPLAVDDERFSDTLPSSMLQHRVRTESPPPLESRESESVDLKHVGMSYFKYESARNTILSMLMVYQRRFQHWYHCSQWRQYYH